MRTNRVPPARTAGAEAGQHPQGGSRVPSAVRGSRWRPVRAIPLALLALLVAQGLAPAPASADGLVMVQCPPVIVSPAGTLAPIPAPREISPSGAPNPIVPPQPPIRRDCPAYLAVKNHNVAVTIDNQIARTRIDETFVNDSSYALEGTYIFPLPDDAAMSGLSMWVDGSKIDGRVLDKGRARQIYEEIVRTQRDPALLEYIGRAAFQARIFPIPPRTEKRVEIEYSQILKSEQGLVRYVYPLSTEKFSPKPLANVSVNVSIKSNAAIKAIYSPSHNVGIARNGEHGAEVGYEDKNVRPDRDFVLYYSTAQDEIGLNVVSHRQPGEDGHFVLLVAPPVDVDDSRVIAKDVILVLDVSGSMQGAKIAQAKNALSYVLDHLNPADRFNIVTFSTGTTSYASSVRPVSARDDARRFVARIGAGGSTDINRALLEAVGGADKERPSLVIFLTDGLPTTGETNTDKIISNVTRAAPPNVRLFTFGVGDDVNTTLLDTLAEKLRGAGAYVRPSEQIDEVVSAFYAKVATPVLSDVTVDWDGVDVSDVHPSAMPDLFAGTQLVLAGRYRAGGVATITVRGTVNGVPQTYRYRDVRFAASGGDDAIPRLWAQRKIGDLLNEIRLHGENREIIDQIVALAVRYGIVTPYTSFLVDERHDVLTQSGRDNLVTNTQSSAVPLPQSGAAAVDRSQLESQLRSSTSGGAAPPKAAGSVAPGQPAPAGSYGESLAVQYVGDKTFIPRDGVWIDTQFDSSRTAATRIEFGSDAYFAFVANMPNAGRYAALGERVIVMLDGAAYEVTVDGTGATAAGVIPTAALASAPPQALLLPGATGERSIPESDPGPVSGMRGEAAAWPLLAGLLAGLALIGGLLTLAWRRRRA